MGRIPSQVVDQIYQTADIVEVISDYLPLKKKGANYWALSPFSNEKTPSFAVNPVKNIYKDFSSGKGGNAVSFLMEMEGYSYVEALRHLAQKYQIDLQEEEDSPEEQEYKDLRQSLLIVNEFAAQFFQDQLLQTERGRNIALSYFKERGVLESTIETFRLGYAPDSWDILAKTAYQKQYNPEYLTTLRLCSRSEKTGNLIDRFRDRVMFPITNPMGKVVGFGGRILSSEKKIAKYINSSESEIYHKSQVLYGMYQAKQHIRNEDLCILTEGYMDTIILHQHGIRHVVASSGTALTPEQVRLIRRFTQNVLMIYDGDPAGIKAAMRGIDLLLKDGLNAQVLLLPDKHDPDSYVRQVGSQAFLDYAKTEALNFIEFKIRVLQEGQDAADPRTQAAMVKELAQTVGNISDLIQRQLYIKTLAQRLDVTEELMTHAVEEARREIAKLDARTQRREHIPPPGQEKAEVKELKSFEQLDLARQEKELLRILINHHHESFVEGAGPKFHQQHFLQQEEQEKEEDQKAAVSLVAFFQVELEGLQFENQAFEQLKNEIIQRYREGQPINIHHYLQHDDAAISNLVAGLLTPTYEISPNWRKHDALVWNLDADLERTVKNAMYHYKYRKVQLLIKENQDVLKGLTDEDQEKENELLEMYMHLLNLKRSIGAKLGAEGAMKAKDGKL